MNKNLLISIIIIIAFAVGMYFVVTNAKPSENKLNMNEENYESMENTDGLEGENSQGLVDLESVLESNEPVMIKIKEGTGEAMSKDGDILGVKYVGFLEDGTQFDSNVEGDTEFNFTLGAGQVIKGWDVGLKDMKVGEIRKLIIPSDYAYGENGIGPIPPNATLLFEVELKSIK